MDEADSLYRNAIEVITKTDEDDTSIDIALDRLRPLDRNVAPSWQQENNVATVLKMRSGLYGLPEPICGAKIATQV